MSNTGEATTTARDQQEEQGKQIEITEQPSQADPTARTGQGEQLNAPSLAEQEPTEQQSGNQPTGHSQQSGDQTGGVSQPKPDVSDQDYQELVPKLLSYFHNKREELARALGLHRSTVDRWLNGKSRPNNSTILRMRRLVQERGIE